MLQKVDFEQKFDQLPQFIPEETNMASPLPQSPRAIISNYKRKRKVSSLGQYWCSNSNVQIQQANDN